MPQPFSPPEMPDNPPAALGWQVWKIVKAAVSGVELCSTFGCILLNRHAGLHCFPPPSEKRTRVAKTPEEPAAKTQAVSLSARLKAVKEAADEVVAAAADEEEGEIAEQKPCWRSQECSKPYGHKGWCDKKGGWLARQGSGPLASCPPVRKPAAPAKAKPPPAVKPPPAAKPATPARPASTTKPAKPPTPSKRRMVIDDDVSDEDEDEPPARPPAKQPRLPTPGYAREGSNDPPPVPAGPGPLAG